MGRIILPVIKAYYIATVIKIMQLWRRDRHMDQWNRTENTNRLTIICPTVFDRDVKAIRQRKASPFNKWWWGIEHPLVKI